MRHEPTGSHERLPLVERFPGSGVLESLFAKWGRRAHTVRLQGGWDPLGAGRFTILGVDPYMTLTARGPALARERGELCETWTEDPFLALGREYEVLSARSPREDLPFRFQGGAMGYLSYELRHFVERVPSRAVPDLPMPDLYFSFFDVVCVYDHLEDQSYLVSSGLPLAGDQAQARARHRLAEAREWLAGAAPCDPIPMNLETVDPADVLDERHSALDKDAYVEAVRRAKEYIAAGDVYQVNLAQRFSVPIGFDAALLFEVLRRVNPAPYGAYLCGPGWSVVSVSPERFFFYDGAFVETRPIKGTRPRGQSPDEDERLRRELLASAKDRAEHVMIVDLERNDLGRFCRFSSVRVPELMVCEAHPTVWHLVSTVRGCPRPGVSLIEGVRSAFPGGSITGAPKVRAMEIIDELEPVARGVYTGSIGYLGLGGRIDLNIAIRTVCLEPQRATFHVGGGIVADSDPQAEYQETLDKGLGIARALAYAERLHRVGVAGR